MTKRTPWAEYERAVAIYTEAGAAETVQRITTALSRLSRRLDVFYNEQFDNLDIERSEWPVLQALAMEGRKGRLNPSGLAETAGVSASTMTHRLDRMLERGLVERCPDPDNRTRMIVSLTRLGWDRFRDAVLRAESQETGVFAALTDGERSDLADLLEKVIAAQTHTASTERAR